MTSVNHDRQAPLSVGEEYVLVQQLIRDAYAFDQASTLYARQFAEAVKALGHERADEWIGDLVGPFSPPSRAEGDLIVAAREAGLTLPLPVDEDGHVVGRYP
ncbi:hypothetical protein [Brachybacterium sp. AOP35-5H-19]|uniref:hypothetical protein n=1 Tax=Brachybacterium sp. AOP35-5H-19 TaxID=3457685 RepID=UPI003FB678BF